MLCMGCIPGYNWLCNMLLEMIEVKNVIVYMDFIQDVTRLVMVFQGAGVEAAVFYEKSCLLLKKIILAKWKASEVPVMSLLELSGWG